MHMLSVKYGLVSTFGQLRGQSYYLLSYFGVLVPKTIYACPMNVNVFMVLC